MSFSNIPTWGQIKSEVLNLDYKWEDPKTWAAIIIPGVSLVFQKIKLDNIKSNSTVGASFSNDLLLKEQRKLAKCVNKIQYFHGLGALVQTIVLVALSRLSLGFTVLAAISAYQTYKTLNMICTHRWTLVPYSDVYSHLSLDFSKPF